MQLIYRGHSFDYAPAADGVFRQSRSINWHYQSAPHHATGLQSAVTSFDYRPNAVNWRYRSVVEV
jgi:hypothetical protein